jgi:hypothetical protein
MNEMRKLMETVEPLFEDTNLVDEEERLDEVLPAIIGAAALGVRLYRMRKGLKLISHAGKKIAKEQSKDQAEKALKQAAKKLPKTPNNKLGMMKKTVKIAKTGGTGYLAYEVYDTITDYIEAISALIDNFEEYSEIIKQIAAVALEYAIPIGLVILAIWGGIAVLNLLKSDDEPEPVHEMRRLMDASSYLFEHDGP